ncbi:DUF4397 domain-containing protein [Pedobacter sp.]|uniref:DUF4397 domain-containing protein n=1 Tax=Pedobacter sp. TaxID=1411316 RepID=UPI003D7F9A27
MMKFSTNAILSFGLLFTLAFSSCKKDKETDKTAPESGTSFISIVNASPGLATYNFYMDDVKMNPAALPLGGSVPYVQVKSATYASKFTSAGTTESLLSKSITLNSNGTYTYFLTGRAGQLDGILSKDEIAGVITQGAIRFVNLSPDANALDLVISGGTTVIANQFYKSISAFVALAPAKYTLNVVDKSTGQVKTSIPNVEVAAGKYYTVLVRGMVSPSDTEYPLAAQLIVNM